MGEVCSFGGQTKLPMPVERVLAGMLETHAETPLRRVLIIGTVEDDGKEVFATSDPDAAAALWDIDRFRHELMKRADEE